MDLGFLENIISSTTFILDTIATCLFETIAFFDILNRLTFLFFRSQAFWIKRRRHGKSAIRKSHQFSFWLSLPLASVILSGDFFMFIMTTMIMSMTTMTKIAMMMMLWSKDFIGSRNYVYHIWNLEHIKIGGHNESCSWCRHMSVWN